MIVKHTHHIIPKHMGGSDDSSNLIELTIEQHAEAHRKLYEEHGHWQDKVAWYALSGQITNAEATKLAQIEANKNRTISEATREKMRIAKLGKSSWNKGKSHTDEHKQKISTSCVGLIRSEETKQKMSKSFMGRPGYHTGKRHTEETKQKIREARLNQIKKNLELVQ